MKKAIILIIVITSMYSAGAQQIAVGQLFDMLDWDSRRMDTTLKKDGYLLMQKDVDSSSALYQYSFLEVKEDAPVTVRSLIYMDVTAGDLKSRLITYRTYSKEEYVDISSYLLHNNFHAAGQFDFGESKHTVYDNGKKSIRVKVNTTQLKDSTTYISYELELGK